jgi:uroporphyrinogen decarboxylase
MNPKERVLAILNREPVDRIPVDIWYTTEVLESLYAHFGADNEPDLYKKMGIDKIPWFGAEYPETGGRTLWGTTSRRAHAGSSEYIEIDKPGLAGFETVESLKDYPYWPEPEKYNYDSMVEKAKTFSQDYVTLGPWVSFYEIYCQMRGLEQAMMDLALMPDYVNAVLDRIEHIQAEMLNTYLGRAADYIDMVFVSDDMGSQNGLLMSLAMWDNFIKPRMERFCKLIHSYGVRVFYHSDGACEQLIERLIETGIDVLNPIQHVCPGMEMAGLKEKYGDRIIFHGGVDTQDALPFGDRAKVRAETLDCLNTLGAGRKGFICCSCHNIQAGTPVENIVEMIETVKKS